MVLNSASGSAGARLPGIVCLTDKRFGLICLHIQILVQNLWCALSINYNFILLLLNVQIVRYSDQNSNELHGPNTLWNPKLYCRVHWSLS
jgi:hypothetical protein